jgi:glycosyltransferase involved in cell wall biosynthesis
MAATNRLVCAPVLRRADCVVFISRAVRTYFDGFCRWRTPPHFVPNGVDTQLFRPPTASERSEARARLQLGAGERVFIFVGRFVEKKGLHLLELLARATPNARWLFAGDGAIDPARWALANVSVHRGRRRETLRELLWAADLLVLPSVGEGFPLVVQEATAVGVPCLVSADTVAGYPESERLLFAEPLGPNAEARWAARLENIRSGAESLPQATTLVAFARAHWNWDHTALFYEKQLNDSPPRS